MGNVKRFVQSGLRGLPRPAKQFCRATAAVALRHLVRPAARANLAEIVNRNLPGGSVVCSRMRSGHKMLVDLRSPTEDRVYYTGEYDARHIETVSKLVRPTWTILDVGAHIGFWSVPLALAAARLYAFEPVAGNYSRLCDNIRINGLGQRITAFPFGLSDRAATIPISLREDFEGGAGTGNAAIVPNGQDPGFRRENIEIRVLDELSLHLERLDFIKLDIEGHEPYFLRGAARTVAKYRPIILTEVNNWYYRESGLDPAVFFEGWMASAGYVCAIEEGTTWRAARLGERKGMITDVFLLPEERAAEFVEGIRGSTQGDRSATIAMGQNDSPPRTRPAMRSMTIAPRPDRAQQ